MMHCDPVTGTCQLPDLAASNATAATLAPPGWTVHYVGDPMCSWCWGLSGTVHALAQHCREQGIGFGLTLGGLRAGGGDPWNDAFKRFLRNEWRHIAQVTGQPFGFSLLDRAQFNYDTEPACRAVVTVQQMVQRQGGDPSLPLRLFSAIQRKFYVEGQDPTTRQFYADICATLGIDFDAFRSDFESPHTRDATTESFQRCRQWGVRSFPTLLLEGAGQITPLAVGYVSQDAALERLRALMETETTPMAMSAPKRGLERIG